MSTPAENHRRHAARFTACVNGVDRDRWDDPAPVEGWRARDVVRHLVTWLPGFLEAGAAVVLPPGPDVDVDPAAAWAHHAAAVQVLLDDPASAARTLRDPHLGELPLAQAIDRFYAGDVFLHTWDLARATGQDESLDPETCRAMYDAMLPLDDLLRTSGQYGPRVSVAEDADVQTKLLGFIGRHV